MHCMFSGLRDVEIGDDMEVGLGNGFSLVKPNEFLLSAGDENWMTRQEFADGANVSRYFLYKHESPFPVKTCEEIKDIFYSGLLALQVLKPVRTLGIVFCGDCSPLDRFWLHSIERRPPMEPPPWARRKSFGQQLLKSAPSAIERVQQITKGKSAERKNAFILLQLGLEHFHPLIAALLWVMGLEAIFDSADKNDFKKKLCTYLGASTPVFLGWKTVEEIAIPLYTLRSKLPHGADLRKAACDQKYPVDLIAKHALPNSSEQVPFALLLSDAACYLLCQVLQKEIALSVP